ncbi:MAG: hypothetical protein OER95_09470, partial [Acidimicrobiia bacterium]|nr:hypothetical protein [Acidimicrobiia bacterium]
MAFGPGAPSTTDDTMQALFDADSRGTAWLPLPRRRRSAGPVVEVAPLETPVVRAKAPLPTGSPQVSLVRPNDGGTIPIPRFRLEAEVDRAYAEVTFAVFVDGGEP